MLLVRFCGCKTGGSRSGTAKDIWHYQVVDMLSSASKYLVPSSLGFNHECYIHENDKFPYVNVKGDIHTIYFLCFPSWSVITYKYNTSVDNTTLYLYTKIVYFVRATCFNLIRSSSGPPRRQIQELYMFHCNVGSQLLTSFC